MPVSSRHAAAFWDSPGGHPQRIAPRPPGPAGSPITLGPGGLFHAESRRSRTDPRRSRAALALLQAAQRYGVPVDPSELQGAFDNAGDWLERVPEVAMLFSERRGSLADSFEFLSQIDGAEDRLFPGRRAFEASFDERVIAERTELRSCFELRKLRRLEELVNARPPSLTAGNSGEVSPAAAAAMLDTDHLTAVKLAIKTKRLPVTVEDEKARLDDGLELVERFSSGFSGVPLDEYYQRFGRECGFGDEVLAITEFLITNRSAFKEQTMEGRNDHARVQAFRELCDNEQRLHALYVFTCADRFEWGAASSESARWLGIRELYLKTLHAFRGIAPDAAATLRADGYEEEAGAVIQDLGTGFFGGLYGRHTNRFGSHLVRLASGDTEEPKAAILRDGAAVILGVAARDFPGLATSITGELREHGVRLSQVHCFSARHHGLVLDLFHFRPGGDFDSRVLPRAIEQAVAGRRHLDSRNALPELPGTIELHETRPGHFRLRFSASQDTPGLVHTLCWKLFHHLQADIHGLASNNTRSGPVIIVHFSVPEDLDGEAAGRNVEKKF